MKDKNLYSVKGEGRGGACILVDVRDCQLVTGETVTIADVQKIGAELPFSVRIEELELFTLEKAFPRHEATIFALAQEAVTIYNLDPFRVQKAAQLAHEVNGILPSKFDEMGGRLNPSFKVLCVRTAKGWYIVRRGSCTCKDHEQWHICKHRIAAWIYREVIARPHAIARRKTTAEILQEMEA